MTEQLYGHAKLELPLQPLWWSDRRAGQRHIAHWRSVKHVDVYHEEEDGYQIVRRRERFSHELTLAYQAGRVVVLKEAEEEVKNNEECT